MGKDKDVDLKKERKKERKIREFTTLALVIAFAVPDLE